MSRRDKPVLTSVSIPSDLLARIDSFARSQGVSRAATFRAFAEICLDMHVTNAPLNTLLNIAVKLNKHPQDAAKTARLITSLANIIET